MSLAAPIYHHTAGDSSCTAGRRAACRRTPKAAPWQSSASLLPSSDDPFVFDLECDAVAEVGHVLGGEAERRRRVVRGGRRGGGSGSRCSSSSSLMLLVVLVLLLLVCVCWWWCDRCCVCMCVRQEVCELECEHAAVGAVVLAGHIAGLHVQPVGQTQRGCGRRGMVRSVLVLQVAAHRLPAPAQANTATRRGRVAEVSRARKASAPGARDREGGTAGRGRRWVCAAGDLEECGVVSCE